MVTMQRWWIVVAGLSALPLLLAELPPIQSYTIADGLAANQINDIVADSLGFVWFCTREGLSRFDGHRFVNFGVKEGLPHRQVTALLETRSGEYLIGTLAGIAAFTPSKGSNFKTYLPGNKFANAITTIFQDSSGRIWCGYSSRRGPHRKKSLTSSGWDRSC